jgi:hypothetical protein
MRVALGVAVQDAALLVLLAVVVLQLNLPSKLVYVLPLSLHRFSDFRK